MSAELIGKATAAFAVECARYESLSRIVATMPQEDALQLFTMAWLAGREAGVNWAHDEWKRTVRSA